MILPMWYGNRLKICSVISRNWLTVSLKIRLKFSYSDSKLFDRHWLCPGLVFWLQVMLQKCFQINITPLGYTYRHVLIIMIEYVKYINRSCSWWFLSWLFKLEEHLKLNNSYIWIRIHEGSEEKFYSNTNMKCLSFSHHFVQLV